jgi:hypothetical protein
MYIISRILSTAPFPAVGRERRIANNAGTLGLTPIFHGAEPSLNINDEAYELALQLARLTGKA